MNESEPIQDARIFELDDVRPLALQSLSEMVRPIRRRQRKGLWASVPDVHQGRVEIRRMRAALGLFAPLLNAKKSERLERKLGRIVRVLGPIRDLDVLVERSLRWALPRRAEAVVQLIYQISAERKRLVAALRPKATLSREHALLKVGNGILAEDPLSGQAWRRELESGVLDELRRLAGPLESDAMLNSEVMEQLHERRKRCRHLRYQLEFLQRSIGADLGIRFFREAQIRLGRVQDAAVIREWFQGEWKERIGRKLLADILACEAAELHASLQELSDFWYGAEGWSLAKAKVELGLSIQGRSHEGEANRS